MLEALTMMPWVLCSFFILRQATVENGRMEFRPLYGF